EQEAAGPGRKGRGEIGAHHVERAMREVDEIHDPEHQRQAGREQEQQQAELQSVQELFDDEQHQNSFRRTRTRADVRTQSPSVKELPSLFKICLFKAEKWVMAVSFRGKSDSTPNMHFVACECMRSKLTL